MKKLILAVLISCALVGTALPGAQAGQTGNKVKVTQVVAYADGAIYVVFDGSICDDVTSSPTWGYATPGLSGATADGVRALLATATAAKLSGRPVTVETKGGVSGGWGCIMGSINMY